MGFIPTFDGWVKEYTSSRLEYKGLSQLLKFSEISLLELPLSGTTNMIDSVGRDLNRILSKEFYQLCSLLQRESQRKAESFHSFQIYIHT